MIIIILVSRVTVISQRENMRLWDTRMCERHVTTKATLDLYEILRLTRTWEVKILDLQHFNHLKILELVNLNLACYLWL